MAAECIRVCARPSSWCLMHMERSLAWWKPCEPTTKPSLITVKLITSTVLTHCRLSWLVPTPKAKNCPCLLWLVLTSLVLSSSSSFLTSTFFLPCWGFVPQKAGAKLLYLWLPSDSCHHLLYNCFLHVSYTPFRRVCCRGKWWLCCTPQWFHVEACHLQPEEQGCERSFDQRLVQQETAFY